MSAPLCKSSGLNVRLTQIRPTSMSRGLLETRSQTIDEA